MSQTWLPPNIAAVCPEQQASLTQCSPLGYMFLALITQLYGKATISLKPNVDFQPLLHSEPIDYSRYQNPNVPLGPIPLKTSEFISDPNLGPALHEEFLPIYHKNDGIPEALSHIPQYNYERQSHKMDLFRQYIDNFYLPISSANFDERLTDVETAASKMQEKSTEKEKPDKEKIRKKRHNIETYDFIVVGAGSAGCVIANRLSEVKKWKVLLIEAGPDEPDVTSVPAFAPVLAQSSIDWMYRTQPEKMTCRAQRGQTCAWLSGRVMGGSSATNFMVYMRGNKRDYDEWAELGNEGWSYKDVLPYFKKSENNQDLEAQDEYHHGTNGPQNVERFSNVDLNTVMLVESFKEKGFPLVDFNGERQLGTMITQTTTKDGRRASTNLSFIRPIRNKRPNLTIKTNSQVTKVCINSHNEAYGIKYKRNGKWNEVHVRKEIILSAGALNSPKILMLSGIGPKLDLKRLNIPLIKDLKVGYNLQDHATTEAVLLELSNNTSTLVSADQIIQNVKDYHKSGTKNDSLSATGVLQITAFHRTKLAPQDITVPDIQFHFDGRNLKEFYSNPTAYLATAVFPFAYYDSINVRPILLHPESRGFLTLNRTHPVFGAPLIYPRFFTVSKDLDTLIDALKFAVELENTIAFKDNGAKFVRKPVHTCSRFKWGTYKYFTCILTRYTGSIYHPSGTCKMGPSYDKDAVVDPRLRVYGVHNLRVADASIMPHIVRGNTNAPCMMIGEKVSDMIKVDWNYHK